MAVSAPFQLRAWIDRNRPELKPPVGNKLLFENSEFIVMAVGGPNSRKDFHHDPGEELFFQLEGDIVLKVVEEGLIRDIPIREGDLFLLPPEIPHSPRRPAGTVGIVVERRRLATERDGFSWYCEACGHRLHHERIAVDNIATELPAVFERFFADPRLCTCATCGTVMARPS